MLWFQCNIKTWGENIILIGLREPLKCMVKMGIYPFSFPNKKDDLWRACVLLAISFSTPPQIFVCGSFVGH